MLSPSPMYFFTKISTYHNTCLITLYILFRLLRFFITSSVLDLTIVGLDTVDGDSNAQGQQPHY
ncbi:hypothetical protein CK203_105690 [Vitis vinifera]|uniref:Uncharacterized protein n=1 Tax=Vitis vinifera TaxID=29760 RepID=A0A438DCS1_VITVI|nr:hypothetical protein CK203_105690 [Vitis vinifera]